MGRAQYLDFAACARRLRVNPRWLRRQLRAGTFIAPSDHDGGETLWSEAAVLRWAATFHPDLAAVAPLKYWPDAAQAAEYLEPEALPKGVVVLSWSTERGVVGVVWDSRYPLDHSLRDTAARLQGHAVLVNVDPDFGMDGPAVRAINTLDPEQEYGLWWRDLSRVLGQPMPYWPLLLRDPGLILTWRPGQAATQAPVQTDLDSAPLLRMAAMFDPTHAVHRTLLWHARTAERRAAESTQQDLDLLMERFDLFPEKSPHPTTTVAAIPLVPEESTADELAPMFRRAAWLDLLARADTLSVRCVREVLSWDGGADFPFCKTQEVDPSHDPGREWASRLEPSPRSAAFELLGAASDTDQTLTDPITDAPALLTALGKIRTAVPQWLPSDVPLAELILGKDIIWVRTQNGTLYPAPQLPTYGLKWGYSGGGPAALAVLIERLLDDITAPGAAPSQAAAGLRELTSTEWPAGTVLTREQLEAARDGRPYR